MDMGPPGASYHWRRVPAPSFATDRQDLLEVSATPDGLFDAVLEQRRHAGLDRQIPDLLDGRPVGDGVLDLVVVDEELVQGHPPLVAGLATGIAPHRPVEPELPGPV